MRTRSNTAETRIAVLRLAQAAALANEAELEGLVREANELVAILTASINSARARRLGTEPGEPSVVVDLGE
jgi:hypothetical protein